MALCAAHAASSKKAERVVILDVSRQLVITDYFVICSGRTDRQVRAVADEVEKQLLQEHKAKPFRREGEQEGRWVLLDYVDFVVHVFHEEERDYYDLERLWSDAPIVTSDRENSWEDAGGPAAAEAT